MSELKRLPPITYECFVEQRGFMKWYFVIESSISTRLEGGPYWRRGLAEKAMEYQIKWCFPKPVRREVTP